MERIAEEASKDKDSALEARRKVTELVLSRDEIQLENGRLREQLRLQEHETKALQTELDKVGPRCAGRCALVTVD